MHHNYGKIHVNFVAMDFWIDKEFEQRCIINQLQRCDQHPEEI